jgi:hypothetical protein
MHRLRLRARIFLLLSGVFLLAGALLSWHLWLDQRQRLQSAETDLMVQARLIATRGDALVGRADALLDSLMANPTLAPAPRGRPARPCWPSCSSRSPTTTRSAWPCPTATRPARPWPPRGPSTSPTAAGFAARWQPGLVIGDMTISRTLGRPTITLSKALRSRTGEVLAVYYLGLNLNWLGRTLAVTQQDDLNVSLLDDTGVFIARYPDAEHWAGSTVQSAEIRRSLAARSRHAGRPQPPGAAAPDRPCALSAHQHRQPVPGAAEHLAGHRRRAGAPPVPGGPAHLLVVLAVTLLLVQGRWTAGSWRPCGPRTWPIACGRASARPAAVCPTAPTRWAAWPRRWTSPPPPSPTGRPGWTTPTGPCACCRPATAPCWAGDEASLLDQMCRAIVEAGGFRLAWIGYAEAEARSA